MPRIKGPRDYIPLDTKDKAAEDDASAPAEDPAAAGEDDTEEPKKQEVAPPPKRKRPCFHAFLFDVGLCRSVLCSV